VHELLHVAAGADLVVVLDVVAQDAALIADVLDPVDELVTPAGQLALEGERGRAREDEDGNATAHRVTHRAAEILRAHVDMDDHGLRLAGHHRVGVRGG